MRHAIDRVNQPTWVIDLDGVVWLAGEPIPGAGKAVSAVRGEGKRILFVTNNSGPRKSVLLSRLSDAGIDACEDDIITAADAAASMLSPGEKVCILGEEGLVDAIEAVGAHIVEPDDSSGIETASSVIVGWSTVFNFDILTRLSGAIRSGARFIGTNEDPTHPSPAGLLPGTGALLAAVAAAAHTAPIVAGKPHDAMVRLVKELVGPTGDIEVVIGDRLSTDKVFASSLDAEFGLVFSEATSLEVVPGELLPHFSAGSLLEVVNLLQAVSK